VTSRRTVAKYLSEGRGRLRFLGFPLEVRIGNDAPTFNTAHLAGPVFLFRNAIEIRRLCVQAQGGLIGKVCRACPDSLRSTVHLRYTRSIAADLSYHGRLVPAMQDTKYGNCEA